MAEGARAGFEFGLEELSGVLGAEGFYNLAIEDRELSRWMGQVDDEDQVVQKANELGFEVGLQDLQAALRGIATEEELAEAELEGVAGGVMVSDTGGTTAGVPNVCKTPAPPSPYMAIPLPGVYSTSSTSSKTTTKSTETQQDSSAAVGDPTFGMTAHTGNSGKGLNDY